MYTSWWTGNLTWAPSVQPVLFCRSPQGLKPTKDNTMRSFDNLPSVRLWASSLDDLWGRLSLRHKRNLTPVKPVCKTAPKSFFGPPPAYQHLSTCHNWPPKKAIHDFLPIRIKGNSKRISGNSFSPFGPQNKHIGAASKKLLIGVKLRCDAG